MPATRWGLTVGMLVAVAFLACGLLTGCGGGGGGAGALATVLGILADDSTLSGLSGGIVSVRGHQSAPTDVSGAFRVDNVPTGNQTLTATLEGYDTYTGAWYLTSGPNNIGTLYMRPSAVPGKGHIVGTVKASGVVVAGAEVTAGGKIAYTKANGTFAIYNLTPGNVSVKATYEAMSGRVVASVVAGGTTTVTINIGIGPPEPPPV